MSYKHNPLRVKSWISRVSRDFLTRDENHSVLPLKIYRFTVDMQHCSLIKIARTQVSYRFIFFPRTEGNVLASMTLSSRRKANFVNGFAAQKVTEYGICNALVNK